MRDPQGRARSLARHDRARPPFSVRSGAFHLAHRDLERLRRRNGARTLDVTQTRRAPTRDDLGLAHSLQLELLPDLSATHSDLRITGAYEPALEVGGDFYEIVDGDPDRISLVIGDVSGKGVVAALMMARVMAEIPRVARHAATPAALLGALNRHICALGFVDRFVTATAIVLDRRAHRMSIANAGHLPAVVRERCGVVRLFGHASGAPLGVVDGEHYVTEACDYRAGDLVLLVTDGVTEALEPNADPASGELMTLVAEGRPDIDELTRRVLDAVHGSRQLRVPDDVALLAMELR